MSEIIILTALILFSAFFSAAETALTSLSRLKVSHLVERKVPGARMVKRLKDEPARMLSTILIGNNIVNITASVMATQIIYNYFAQRGGGNAGLIIGAATGIMTFFILVFGEITPKTTAIRQAEKFALLFAYPLYLISILLMPVATLLTWISAPFVLLLGGRIPEQGPFITEEELRFLISAGEKEGVLEREEKEMISSIFEFGDTLVREVMTPRPDILAIEDSEPVEKAIDLIKDSGHSRIPIYENNIDNVLGVIYAKDLLSARDGNLKDYMRSALFIPETKRVAELLHQMQSNRTHLAIVVDEYGVTSGLVTMEDLIEEIVGEIHDEFERGVKNLEKLDESTYLVDGKVAVDEVNQAAGLDLPTDESDSLGGLVFGRLGKVPAVGDMVKFDGTIVYVERLHRRRVTRLKIVKSPPRFVEESEIAGG
ncbi:HlyC/CorC family transporter [Candidatus Saganbacteria bacterium]|nr:HlyC/CorC family transporter [Candidatus Saganbacteria bacterium]